MFLLPEQKYLQDLRGDPPTSGNETVSVLVLGRGVVPKEWGFRAPVSPRPSSPSTGIGYVGSPRSGWCNSSRLRTLRVGLINETGEDHLALSTLLTRVFEVSFPGP